MNRLSCHICNESHKAISTKFPYVVRNEQGKIVAYTCKKCVLKELKKEEKRKATAPVIVKEA
jgi:formate dehydrogenase maturation protein FdhE